MKLKAVAVRDKAVGAFMLPNFCSAVGQATRGFRDQVNADRQDNPVFKHPGDFDLFELGEFDDETGKFVSLPDPVLLATGLSCKE